MATMDITEGSFQTTASEKRKASGSPSSQPTMLSSNYKKQESACCHGY